MYVLLLFIMPHIRHMHLDLHIGVSLKGRTARIWSFGCSFVYATTMGYARFDLSFGIVIVL